MVRQLRVEMEFFASSAKISNNHIVKVKTIPRTGKDKHSSYLWQPRCLS